MQKYSAPSINLAKNRGEHLSDRILSFALSIGRVLVIITEAIALGAFLFRFGLDRQLVDLHDRIKQEQAIVNLLKNNEATYRNLQDRLSLEKAIDAGTVNSLKLYTDVTNMVPTDMTITSMSFSDTNIRVEASVSTLVSLSAFVNKLKTYSAIDRVSLDKLENKTSEGIINFNMTIYIKQTPNKVIL